MSRKTRNRLLNKLKRNRNRVKPIDNKRVKGLTKDFIKINETDIQKHPINFSFGSISLEDINSPMLAFEILTDLNDNIIGSVSLFDELDNDTRNKVVLWLEEQKLLEGEITTTETQVGIGKYKRIKKTYDRMYTEYAKQLWDNLVTQLKEKANGLWVE